MEYEHDRKTLRSSEPTLSEMTAKAIELLASNPNGFVLVVEGGRIDHAHHSGNAFRALVETEELDNAIGYALAQVDLNRTLVIVTADHSHGLGITGYPRRRPADLGYKVKQAPSGWLQGPHNGIRDGISTIDMATGNVVNQLDSDGVPHTALLYLNGPGYRRTIGVRSDPWRDAFKGYNNAIPNGPSDPAYRQEAAVPNADASHSGEDVAIFAIGAGSSMLHGCHDNTQVFVLLKNSLGL
jgi:alkaline phosphatase